VVFYEGVVADVTERVEAKERLAATEALLLAAMEQSPAGVIVADSPDVSIRLANSAALGIRGRSPQPLTEIPAELHPQHWQVFRPDGSPCEPEDLPLTRAVTKGEVVRDEEYIIRRESGEDRWVLASASPVRNDAGEIVAGVVVFPDITERKRARSTLERREAILAAVGYAAGCFLTAPAWEENMQEVLARLGRAARVSRSYVFRAHVSAEGAPLVSQLFEWVEEGVRAFIDDPEMQGLDMQASGLGRWAELLEDGEVVAGHLRDFPANEQWLIEAQDIRSILLVPVFAGERWWGLMGFDACAEEREWTVSEVEALHTAAQTLGAAILRKEAEAERARLAAAVDQVADSIVITNREGIIQYVNPAFERSSGYSAGEVLGKSPRILKSGMHDAAFYEGLWRTITAGRTWRGRLVNRRKDGSLFEEEAAISPLRDDTGEIVSFVGVKRDVTEQALLERQLRHAQRMESLGRLAGGIAHDFNNVMGQILSAAELLDRHAGDERLRGYVELILQAVNRGRNITERMLSFSRDEEGPVGSVSACGLLQNLAEVGKHTFPKGVTLELDLPDEDSWIRCDSAQIQQAIMNLCINSVDAMPEGGLLTLGMHRASRREVERRLPEATGEFVCLTVTDTGTGMGEETLERIFLPFYTQKPIGQGTGLGLYIVYGIVQSHGGWIWVNSLPGRGTTVTVGLPAAKEPPERPRMEPVVKPVSGDGRRVLVVDDEIGLLVLLSEVLQDAGYEVRCATDGREALGILETHGSDLDVLVTDIGMPNMGGRELVERVREDWPHLRVVVASGYMDTEEHLALRELGVGAVLTKPFHVDEVARVVGEVLVR
jgi:PAS domain S-box-containing protein